MSSDDLGKMIAYVFLNTTVPHMNISSYTNQPDFSSFKKHYMKIVRKKISEFYPETGPIVDIDTIDDSDVLEPMETSKGTLGFLIQSLADSGSSFSEIYDAVSRGAKEYRDYESKRDTVHKKLSKEYDFILRNLENLIEVC